MHVTPLWQKFKQLGILDREIICLAERRHELIAEIVVLRTTVAEQETILERAESDRKKMSHAVALSEADIAAVVAKMRTKEKDLETTSNVKARVALEHEIFSLKKNCAELEDTCLDLLAQLETMERFKTVDAPAVQNQLIQSKARLADLEQELAAINSSEIKNQSEQTTLINSISPEWFTKYQEMKIHIKDPIAPVIQNSCGACFYDVLAQDLSRLKNNAILPCRSCFRFLYCDAEVKP